MCSFSSLLSKISFEFTFESLNIVFYRAVIVQFMHDIVNQEVYQSGQRNKIELPCFDDIVQFYLFNSAHLQH